MNTASICIIITFLGTCSFAAFAITRRMKYMGGNAFPLSNEPSGPTMNNTEGAIMVSILIITSVFNLAALWLSKQ